MAFITNSVLALAIIATSSSVVSAGQNSPPPPPAPRDNGPMPMNGFETNQFMTDLSGKTGSKGTRQKSPLAKQEQRALEIIDEALNAKKYPEAQAAIDEANAAATSGHARYAIATRLFRLGTETKDEAAQDRAIDAALATGVAPAATLPALYKNQGVAALLAKDYGKAEAAFTKVLGLAPADANTMVLLAETMNRANRPAEALILFERAISINGAANLETPAEWSHAVSVLRVKLDTPSGQR